MAVTVKRTGKKAKIDTAPPMMRALANKCLEIIKARCAQGLDITDRPFARYDEDYAKIVGGNVDLTVKKNAVLFKTLKATVRMVPGGAVITIAPASGLAVLGTLLQRGTPSMPARPWLGMSPRDLVVLRPAAERLLSS